jgi:hypothetical protein
MLVAVWGNSGSVVVVAATVVVVVAIVEVVVGAAVVVVDWMVVVVGTVVEVMLVEVADPPVSPEEQAINITNKTVKPILIMWGRGPMLPPDTSSGCAMATLVFLAAATRARVVAPNLVRCGGFARLGSGRVGLHSLWLSLRLGHLDVEEIAHRVPLHRLDHVHEHVIALALVLGEWITLSHRTKTDTGPEIVHL